MSRIIAVCLLLAPYLALFGCSDSTEPTGAGVTGSIGATGGFVTLPGVATLGVPPAIIDEPADFSLAEPARVPTLPDRYQLLVAVDAQPADRTFAVPLEIEFTLDLPGDGPWSLVLLRREGDAWQRVTERFGTRSRERRVVSVHELGSLAVALDGESQPVGLSVLFTHYVRHGAASLGGEDAVESASLAVVDHETLRLRELDTQASFAGREMAHLHSATQLAFSTPVPFTEPGDTATVRLEGTAELPGLEFVYEVPGGQPRLTSPTPGQVIDLDSDLDLVWEGTGADFLMVRGGPGSIWDNPGILVPDIGSCVVPADTLQSWAGHGDHLFLGLQGTDWIWYDSPEYYAIQCTRIVGSNVYVEIADR